MFAGGTGIVPDETCEGLPRGVGNGHGTTLVCVANPVRGEAVMERRRADPSGDPSGLKRKADPPAVGTGGMIVAGAFAACVHVDDEGDDENEADRGRGSDEDRAARDDDDDKCTFGGLLLLSESCSSGAPPPKGDEAVLVVPEIRLVEALFMSRAAVAPNGAVFHVPGLSFPGARNGLVEHGSGRAGRR